MHNRQGNNTYGRATIDTRQYLQSISITKEGEAEMEEHTWRGLRWIKVFLYMDNNDFIVFQNKRKSVIKVKYQIRNLKKVCDCQNVSFSIEVLFCANSKSSEFRLRFWNDREKDEWRSLFQKASLLNYSSHLRREEDRSVYSDGDSSSDVNESPEEEEPNEESSSSDDLGHYPFSYTADCSRYLRRPSILEKVQNDSSSSNPPSLTDNDITRMIHDAEEYIQLQNHCPDEDDSEIPVVSHSGCAWSVSYQNKKPRNEDRVYLNTCVKYELHHYDQDHFDNSYQSEYSPNPSISFSDREILWCNYQKGTGKALFAIFDGHNGADCAEYCQKHLLEVFLECYSSDLPGEDLLQLIIRTLEFKLEMYLAEYDISSISGCTCLICYLHDSDLFVANLGDTQGYLARDDYIIELGQVHDAVFDQQRILQAGGWITTMREEARTRLGSIVAPPTSSGPGSPQASSPRIPFITTGGTKLHASRHYKYYVNGAIEVARSLGDFYLKHQRIGEYHWNYPTVEREKEGSSGFIEDVVSSEPFVKEFKLTASDRFIVLATDGFWEVVNPEACRKIVEAFYHRYSMEDIGKMLFWISKERGSYDNISIILVDLRYSVSSMNHLRI